MAKQMTKNEKKRMAGSILFVTAGIQILNFAIFDPAVFPRFHLSPGKGGLLRMLAADIDWPFRFINFCLYYLLGWTAFVTPLFFIALGMTLFTKRETDGVRRQRIVYVWRIAQLTLFAYFINLVSWVIIPATVKAGVLTNLFVTYLSKVGGPLFAFAFFVYTSIAYMLYVRRMTWAQFRDETRTLLAKLFGAVSSLFAGGTGSDRGAASTGGSGRGNSSSSATRGLEDKHGKESAAKKSAPRDAGKSSAAADDAEDEDDAAPAVIDADYRPAGITEFDSTKNKFTFKAEALSPGESHNVDRKKLGELGKKIEDTYASFGVKLKRAGETIGPRLIRYEYEFPQTVKLKDLEKHAEELSNRLGGLKLDLQIPIPGTDRFGIYVGRDEPDVPGLRPHMQELAKRKESVPLFIGVGSDGNAVWADATTFPHLLIAGTTGSGKSVFLNSVILNLIAASTSTPINLILIDPKRVEFAPYASASQLSHSIITDVDEARSILGEAEELMEDRYKRVTAAGARNIEEFNKKKPRSRMPFLFVIIDEFADIVMQDKSGEIKNSIIRLAQKSRAVGIHVMIATQRPSANVIDGLIKANFPARVAFKTASKVDARIILDENGAENLLGRGDMLAKISGDETRRLQAVYVDIAEIEKVVG